MMAEHAWVLGCRSVCVIRLVEFQRLDTVCPIHDGIKFEIKVEVDEIYIG